MSSLEIKPIDGRTEFEPGETIEVGARWDLAAPPNAVELRLVWSTRGKGESDLGVVRTVRFEEPGAAESRQWSIDLPNAPYSFSGKLISLVWALELEAEPSDESAQCEIIIGPGSKEVRLH